MIKDVVNGWFEGNELRLLTDDGAIVQSELQSIEYPYFYGDKDLSNETGVISCKPITVDLVSSSDIVKTDMYKIEVYNPYVMRSLAKKCNVTAESDIPYIERRLGADGYIEWVRKPTKYAFIDIEERNGEIDLIGCIDSISKEYLAFYDMDTFLHYIYRNRITIMLAWNGLGYDYIRMKENILGDEPYQRWYDYMLKLDAMQMYSTYLQKQLISLDKAAQEQGLQGKLTLTTSFDDVGMEELEDYNKRDVEVLRDIVETTGILELNCEIANHTGIKIDQVSAVRMFDNLLLKKYNPQGAVLLDSDKTDKKPYRGGTTISELFGLFHDTAFLDYTGLYPSVILNEEYTKDKGKVIWNTLREFVGFFVNERKKLKEQFSLTKEKRFDVSQRMYKIFGNSLYGVTANTYFRFYEPDIPEFITDNARRVLMKLRGVVKKYGYDTPYSDTDSALIINLPADKIPAVEAIVNKEIYPYSVKVEKPFKSIFIMKNLKSDKGLKKRYVGYTSDGKLVPVGVELVRNDWTPIAKEVEENVFYMILRDGKSRDDIDNYIQGVRKSLPSLPADKFLFSKVMDLQKDYKVKTPGVQVLELAGYKLSTRTIKEANGTSKIYRFAGYKEKLINVRWLIGSKHSYIYVGENDNPNLYKHLIDYEWYYKKQIVTPIDRILQTMGGKLTVLPALGENKFREKYGGIDLFMDK